MILLGAGNMATNLAHAFRKAGASVRLLYSHTYEHAEHFAKQVGVEHYTDSLADVNACLRENPDETVLYCLKDSVLRDVLMQIDAPEALHLHTAGSLGLSVFEGTNKPHAGVFYPFQTMSKDRVLDFGDIPVFIESVEAEDAERVRGLAQMISANVYPADSQTRRRLHLAGVFANNFANCMYAIAGEVLQGTGLPADVLLPLIDETAEKVHSLSPRDAQTGPAKRYDENVMQAHLDMLGDENLQAIYRAVSANIHAHTK